MAYFIQQCLVTPGRLGDQMVQRLARRLNIARIESRRHRLNALTLTGQQQALTVILQRRMPVFVPRGVRQAIHICREAFLLWAWRRQA